MSLDDQSVTISPSAVDSLLPGAQLNGTKLNGHALESKDSSPTSERLQVINDEKNFTSVLLTHAFLFYFGQVLNDTFHRTHLASQIERWGLRDVGFNYNIVAVFGSQSTGKSKLTSHGLHVQSTECRGRHTPK